MDCHITSIHILSPQTPRWCQLTILRRRKITLFLETYLFSPLMGHMQTSTSFSPDHRLLASHLYTYYPVIDPLMLHTAARTPRTHNTSPSINCSYCGKFTIFHQFLQHTSVYHSALDLFLLTQTTVITRLFY